MQIIKMGGLELVFLQTKDETGGALDVFEMQLQPRARMPVAHHHTTWDETVIGLEGTSTWTVAGESIALEPGRSIFIRRGIVHGFDNTSAAPAVCLCILTPGVLGTVYFEEMASLLADPAPDRAAMVATMLRHGLIPAAPTPG